MCGLRAAAPFEYKKKLSSATLTQAVLHRPNLAYYLLRTCSVLYLDSAIHSGHVVQGRTGSR